MSTIEHNSKEHNGEDHNYEERIVVPTHQHHHTTPDTHTEPPDRRKTRHAHSISLIPVTLGVLGILIIGGLGALYLYGERHISSLSSELVASRDAQQELNESFEIQLRTITDALREMQLENAELLATLEDEQRSVARSLERELERVTDTVGDLERLTRTDPRLLQKYSSVFFLNEHYEPERLVEVPSRWIYDESRVQRFHAEAWPFLERLLRAAQRDNVRLYVASGYRSFTEQSNIKTGYTVRYGAGTANTFSADQGYSEHQLGTAVDFTTEGLNGGLDGFEETDAYQWLLRNAHNHGFILSYPPGNEYFIFEPWHWRFVGVRLARDLNRRGEFFYDWSQRDIDKYLIYLFDR